MSPGPKRLSKRKGSFCQFGALICPCILGRDLDMCMFHVPDAFGSHQSNISHVAVFTTEPTSFSRPTCPLCSFLVLWALIFLQHTKMRTLRTSALKAGIDSEALSPGSKSPKWCDCHPLPFCQRYAWEVVFYAFSTGSWKGLSTHLLFDC